MILYDIWYHTNHLTSIPIFMDSNPMTSRISNPTIPGGWRPTLWSPAVRIPASRHGTGPGKGHRGRHPAPRHPLKDVRINRFSIFFGRDFLKVRGFLQFLFFSVPSLFWKDILWIFLQVFFLVFTHGITISMPRHAHTHLGGAVLEGLW